MPNRHELRVYDYINRPYERVRDALHADALGVLRTATGTKLHAHAGPMELETAIAIDLRSIEPARSPDDRPATSVVVEWHAVKHAELFPKMSATIAVYALTPTETQLELRGTYDPPLGVLGDALDATAMRGIAEQAVTNFVHEVAQFLRRGLAA